MSDRSMSSNSTVARFPINDLPAALCSQKHGVESEQDICPSESRLSIFHQTTHRRLLHARASDSSSRGHPRSPPPSPLPGSSHSACATRRGPEFSWTRAGSKNSDVTPFDMLFVSPLHPTEFLRQAVAHRRAGSRRVEVLQPLRFFCANGRQADETVRSHGIPGIIVGHLYHPELDDCRCMRY